MKQIDLNELEDLQEDMIEMQEDQEEIQEINAKLGKGLLTCQPFPNQVTTNYIQITRAEKLKSCNPTPSAF